MTFSQLMAAVLTGLVCLCPPARAQESYPSKLITIVAPITAGTTIDILARLYADKLSKRFGQQVVVLNRPGAGGLIAAQAVASSPADGYTLIFVNSGHTILGTLNKNLPFDPVRDFAGVSLVGEAPTIVTVALGAAVAKEPVTDPTSAHSSALTSLGYRNALRSYRPRFFAVHTGDAPRGRPRLSSSQMI